MVESASETRVLFAVPDLAQIQTLIANMSTPLADPFDIVTS